jgi:hypothetical protein
MSADLIHPEPHPRAPHETRDARTSYAEDVRRFGMSQANRAIADGHVVSAYSALVTATEAEARLVGIHAAFLKAGPGMRSLIAHQRAKQVGAPRPAAPTRYEVVIGKAVA